MQRSERLSMTRTLCRGPFCPYPQKRLQSQRRIFHLVRRTAPAQALVFGSSLPSFRRIVTSIRISCDVKQRCRLSSHPPGSAVFRLTTHRCPTLSEHGGLFSAAVSIFLRLVGRATSSCYLASSSGVLNCHGGVHSNHPDFTISTDRTVD